MLAENEVINSAMWFYDLMRAGKSEDQLYQERESDELVRDTWRRMTIYGIINSCPKNFRAAVKFNDWRTAMKYLRKHQKEVA